MTIVLREPHQDLTFMTPLSQARADSLVQFLASDVEGTVVDVGCGWAELLLRIVAAAPFIRGVGVDTDEAAIQHGRDLAARRGLADRVSLIIGDARDNLPQHAQAVVCIGASQVWGPDVDDLQPLDYASALSAVRAMVPRGAHVVFGEGVWSTPPTPEAAAALGGRLDEFVSVSELVELAVANGFMPVAVHEATLDEWDEFESGYGACFAWWLAEHGRDHPDAREVQDRAARQRARFLDGYRGVLGMAYLALVAV